MKEKVKTAPNLVIDSPAHLQALVDGDDHYRLWQRNVVDEFKDLPNEEIKKRLQETAFPYAVCFENWINDFNLASGFRNANAFNAQGLYYVGNKKFDRRGMCGIHNYMDIEFLPTIEDLLKLKNKYIFVGIDNIGNAKPLTDYQWQPNTLMIFGSEAVGLTPGMQALCQEMVYIPQYGSIRSLNAATASGIVMNDFVSKIGRNRRANNL
jgi:tRNA G18 (ribose-2'-O)-methylase SpoU